MDEAAHPELDDSPLANAEEHTKFRSLVGCTNWLVTLVRFDIALMHTVDFHNHLV